MRIYVEGTTTPAWMQTNVLYNWRIQLAQSFQRLISIHGYKYFVYTRLGL